MTKSVMASFEIVEYPTNPLLSIEKVARDCYQSEGAIEPGSADKIVRMLLKKNHGAMIEFGGWIVVAFVSNRGFTHEMVRMRLCSFAQESTRWCNYAKEKFGHTISVIDPTASMAMRVKDPERVGRYNAKLIASWMRAEADYLDLVDDGCPAEMAREVLPIGLKAKINVGANVREWRWIVHERTSPQAHPRMREVMIPLLREFYRRTPLLWEDLIARVDNIGQ